MSFLAVLLALFVEQLRPLPHGNPIHEALIAWVRWTGRNFDAGREHHAWVVWAVSLIVPALLVWGVYALLFHFSLLLALAWILVVLYLTLGFRQFSHYFTDIREALERGDEEAARALLQEWRHLDASELPRTAMCSACSSGSCCCRRSASGRPARCCTAWPSWRAATGPSRAAPSARRSTSA